ncbi:MAG: hypothetical protein Q9195_008380 [Heterodermia aff. obscurata]
MSFAPSLPNEVLVNIFSLLSGPRTFVHLARVCKQFNAVVRPFQYRSIELSIVDPPVIEPGKASKFDRLQEILDADDLLRRKAATLSVTVLGCNWIGWCGPTVKLVHTLPYLQSLRLSPPPVKLKLHGHTVLHSLYLDFKYYSLYFWIKTQWLAIPHPRFLSSFFWLPSLRNLYTKSLDLQFMFPHHRFTKKPEKHYRASPVTTLRLRDGATQNIDTLPDMIQSIRALNILTLELNLPCQSESINGIPMRSFIASLASHTDTLVELIIAPSNMAQFPRDFVLGNTLKRFTSLQRIGIPETFLAYPPKRPLCEFLPSSLVVVQMQYPMTFDSDIDREIQEEHPDRILRLLALAAHKTEHHPSLTRFIWWEQQPLHMAIKSYGNRADFQNLKKELGTKEVEFTFVSSPFYAGTPLAAEEFEEEANTRWNVPSEKYFTLEEIFGLEGAEWGNQV